MLQLQRGTNGAIHAARQIGVLLRVVSSGRNRALRFRLVKNGKTTSPPLGALYSLAGSARYCWQHAREPMGRYMLRDKSVSCSAFFRSRRNRALRFRLVKNGKTTSPPVRAWLSPAGSAAPGKRGKR